MTEQDAQERIWNMGAERLGQFGEAIWARIFKASNVNYIPLHQMIGDGAPMAQGQDKMILPDFDVAGEKWCAYVDSKAKTRSILFRRMKQERHGIDRRNWQQYQLIASKYKKTCGLGIVEGFTEVRSQWSGSLLLETLSNLGQPALGMNDQGHMVYWPRKLFVELDRWSALELLAIANGQLKVSYEHELTHIFYTRHFKQQQLFSC